jgi:hypothetical protein
MHARDDSSPSDLPPARGMTTHHGGMVIDLTYYAANNRICAVPEEYSAPPT